MWMEENVIAALIVLSGSFFHFFFFFFSPWSFTFLHGSFDVAGVDSWAQDFDIEQGVI